MLGHVTIPIPFSRWKKNYNSIIEHYYPTVANTTQIAVQINKDIRYYTVICTVEKSVCRQQAHAKLSLSPSFIDKFIDYSSWIINL